MTPEKHEGKDQGDPTVPEGIKPALKHLRGLRQL